MRLERPSEQSGKLGLTNTEKQRNIKKSDKQEAQKMHKSAEGEVMDH